MRHGHGTEGITTLRAHLRWSLRLGVAGVAATLMLSAGVIVPAEASIVPAHAPTPAGATTLAAAPPALRAAVEKEIAAKDDAAKSAQLAASGESNHLRPAYTAAGAQFHGAGFEFTVGRGSVGRGDSSRALTARTVKTALGTTYGEGSVTDAFRTTASGIEQSFHISNAPTGSGQLEIDVPVSGLTAVSSSATCRSGTKLSPQVLPQPRWAPKGSRISEPTLSCVPSPTSIELRNAAGQFVASYSGLRVTDAAGKVLTAAMKTAADGKMIVIDVNDAGATYPITVDPTWSYYAELDATDGAAYSDLGVSAAISGTTAVVGSPGQTTVDGHSEYGAAYVFTLSDGTWSPSGELVPTTPVALDFGASVAISGSTIVVGASGGYVVGQAYVFKDSGGTWGQVADLTGVDEQMYDGFGSSVSISGSTILVGAPGHEVDSNAGQGEVYVFTLSGTTWGRDGDITATTGGGASDAFGTSVALSGDVAAIGAPYAGDSTQGALYVFTFSGGSWGQAADVSALDGASSDEFGSSVAVSGSTVVVGAPRHESGSEYEAGAAYVFTPDGDSWSQSAELADASPAEFDLFGWSVAISGSTLVVGEIGYGYEVGAATVFALEADTWQPTLPLTAIGGAEEDDLGWSVGISGANVLAGSPAHATDSDRERGAAYIFSDSGEAPKTGTSWASDDAAVSPPGCTHKISKTSKTDPVDCASGDFYETFTDAAVPGYGPSLDLTRTYNSLDYASEGIFGYGWTSSYESSLTFNDDSSITVTEADGSQVTAEPVGDDYTLPAWSDSTLTTSGSDYVFVRQATETYTYNSSGQLISIADLNGDTTHLYYTSGRLTSVENAASRTLTLAYGENGLVSSVTDPMDRVTNYSYDDSDNLTSVEDPMGHVTSFTHGTGDYAHMMLTMKLPNGQSGGPDAGDDLVNTFNGSGQILTQTDQKEQETTYTYAGDNFDDSGGTTTITDPDGNETLESYVDGEMVAETTGYTSGSPSTTTYAYDPDTLGKTVVTDPDAAVTSDTYDGSDNLLTSTNALGNTSSYAYNSFNEQTCAATPLAPTPCYALTPPSAITPGGTIYPPGSAAAPYVTYTAYDTDGNEVYTTTGAYPPDSDTALYSRTSYNLYNGESITLDSNLDSCTTSAPSTSLPCATISPDDVVTQLAYNSDGDLTSSSTPDGNADDEVAKATYSYDADGEQTSTVSPDGNLSGANAGNYTTATNYNGDGERTAVTVGGGSGHTVVPRVTTYAYDGDGNLTSSTNSRSVDLVGTASGHNSSDTLSLSLPAGTLAGDEAILSTTTSSPGIAAGSGEISTDVGPADGPATGDNGPATESLLDSPEGVAFDSSGDEYIADRYNNRIQEVAATDHTQWGIAMSAGDIYTVAGSAAGGSGNSGGGGPATSALLYYPEGVAVDGDGNLYIADTWNYRVEEVAATTHTQWGMAMTAGDIYTVAGSGVAGDSGGGGSATSAELGLPQSIAFDASGDLYIADSRNNQLLEVAASAGTQWGISMSADDVYVIAGDPSGTSGHSGDGGAATSALLDAPWGLAFDSSGDLYIADGGNNRVQEIAAASGSQWGISMTADDMYTVAGNASGISSYTGDGGGATAGYLGFVEGVAVDTAGDLYILDSGYNRVREVPVSSGTQWGISMTADDIYTVAGSVLGDSGTSGDGGAATSALLDFPTALAIDTDGDLAIADGESNTVREVAATSVAIFGISMTAGDIYTTAGELKTAGDGGLAAESQLNNPSSVAFDAAGNEYILDAYNNRVQEIAASTHTQWGISMTAGDVYTVAGDPSGSTGDSSDGAAATSPSFSYPSGIAVDSAGDLFIADTYNSRIEEVPASSGTQFGIAMTAGDIYTVAGDSSGSTGDSSDGAAATSPSLTYPSAVAVDAAGDLFIADTGNNRIEEVPSSSGTQFGIAMTADDIYTVAGDSAGSSGDSGDGSIATSALLDGPAGISLDSAGDLLIADTYNDRIQEVPVTPGTQFGVAMTADDIYTIAGESGTPGDSGDGGAATSAVLYWPNDVVVDSSGDLYIADSSNSQIQEVPVATGEQWGTSMTADDIYDVAGNAYRSAGYTGDGGLATSALLDDPLGVALDPTGDLYIADTANNRVQEVAGPSSGSGDAVTTPSGYSLIETASTTGTTTHVYAHRIESGDTGVTLDYSASDPKAAVLAVYRGVSTATPIDAYDDATTSSGTSVSVSAITTSVAGDELVFIAGATEQSPAGTWTAPSGMTNEAADSGATGMSTFLADGLGPVSAGSTGSESATASTTGELAAVLLALEPGSVTSSTAYDADDEATVATDADGNSTLNCYDGDGNVVETVPPVDVALDSLTAASCPTSYPTDYGDRLAGDATTTTYDAQGEKTSDTTPAPAGRSGHETTTYAYDAAGRLSSVTAPPTSTTGGASDDVTAYTYDAAGELLTTTTGSGTATEATTSSCYDLNGNVTATVTGDGNTPDVATCSSSSPYDSSSTDYQTTYAYDSLGEVVTETRPDTSVDASGMVTTFSYDDDGNVLTSEDANGVTTTNTYTPLDQLASIGYSGSAAPSVTYTYDADGNRTQMTDGTGTSSYTYDPFGELTSMENGDSKTVSYAYDALGDQTSVTYPLGGGATWANSDAVAYGYDAASELTSLTDFNGNTSLVTNNADGLPSAVTLGNSGDSIDAEYDPTDSPSSITLTDGSTLQEFAYSDEPSGAVATETDTPSSSLEPADYTYDAQSRVTEMVPGTSGSLTYDEDDSDNLTTLPTGATGTYDYASELSSSVLSGTTTDFTYDADGERTEEEISDSPTMTATYNGAEELSSYSNSAADMTAATYDGDGVRASATSTPTGGGSSTQHFVWDESGPDPELLMDSTNAYLYGPSGTPIEQVNLSSGTVQYLVADALGSVRGVVSSDGSLSASTSYDAWGNPETTGGLTADTPFGFAGGYTDPSGLVYLIHRYYDPTTGQFLTVDPEITETGQAYAYIVDDPVNGADPLGLWSLGDLNPIPDLNRAWNDTGGKVVTAVDQHWRGIAQVATTVAIGALSTLCVIASDGVCAAALPAFGALTSEAVYLEGGGRHTGGGAIGAIEAGSIGGFIAAACALGACEIAGSLIAGSVLANGLWGAGTGVYNYWESTCDHTLAGAVGSAEAGAASGGIPWDLVARWLSRIVE